MNEAVCFRREFQFDPAEWPGIRGLKLSLDSKLPSIEAWLNGIPLKLPPTGHGDVKLQPEDLKRGRNVLAVRVGPSEGSEEFTKSAGKSQKAQTITYGANVFPRPDSGDEVLSKSELQQLGLFRSLKRMPGVEEYPNSIVLRKYSAGDAICYQGQPGSSAFYILTSEDLYRLRCSQAKFLSPDVQGIQAADLTPDRLRIIWDHLQRRIGQLAQADNSQMSVRQSEKYRKQLGELTQDVVLVEDQLVPLADRIWIFKNREEKFEKELKAGKLQFAEEAAIQAEKDKLRAERRAATVHIIPGANRVAQPRSWFGRAARRLFGGGGAPLDQNPAAIRNDGPSDVDYASRQAPMFEGDLFGEMACMTNAPRSATVTADGEVYMLEFLKNVFNLIQKDEGYREQILQKYRERVLSSHLDRLEFFQELTPEQKATLSNALDLKIVDAGTVIFNEEEPSDCVYIIRTGLVQVVKGIRGVHVALNMDAVTDWPGFAQELLKGDPGLEIPCPECGHMLRLLDRRFLNQSGRCPECRHKFLLKDPAEVKAEIELTTAEAYKTGGPKSADKKPQTTADKIAAMKAKAAGQKKTATGKAGARGGASALLKKKTAPTKGKKADPHDYQKAIWHALPERAQNAIRRVAAGIGRPNDEMQILVALNELIKSRELIDTKSLNPTIANEKSLATYPRNRKQWTGLQICVAGRLILQNVYPQHLKKPADDQEAGPIRILAYLSSGDILGEMGVVEQSLRTATCIAWDHPTTEEGRNREPGQVHLISIKAEAFEKLMQDPDPGRRRAGVDPQTPGRGQPLPRRTGLAGQLHHHLAGVSGPGFYSRPEIDADRFGFLHALRGLRPGLHRNPR